MKFVSTKYRICSHKLDTTNKGDENRVKKLDKN